MSNTHLFELMNAGPGLDSTKLLLAVLLAKWLVLAIPAGLIWVWVCGPLSARVELLEILLAAMLALAFAQVVAWVWPQPRPFALHLGTQYLAHAGDPGLPSDHVTLFWSLALSALFSRRFAIWGFPLLAIGLAVGWSRVYLGVHFPFDILAALPVALVGACTARAMCRRAATVFKQVLDYDNRWRSAVGDWLRHDRNS